MERTNTLSRRLVQGVVLLSFIAILGLIVAIGTSLWGTAQSVEARLNNAGQQAAHTFDQFLGGVESDLLATSAALLTTGEVSDLFRRTLERQFAIFELVLVDPQGLVLAQRRRIGVADLTTLAAQPWQATVQAGEVYIGPVNFEEFGVPFIDLAVAVTDHTGNFRGTLVARVDLATLWNTATSLKVGQTGYVYVTNQTGQLLAYRNLQLVRGRVRLEDLVGYSPQAIAESGFEIYTGVSDQTVIASSTPLEVVPWFVIVEQPVNEAFGSFMLYTSVLLGALLIAILLVYGIINFTRHRIVLPLVLLREGVDILRQGNLEHRIDIQTKDEFGTLARTFNNMTTQLQEIIDSLEQRVAARTKRLEIVATFSERISGILDLEAMLVRVVTLIKDRLGYYHAHIYLLDDTREKLVMAAGAGEAGAEMKARGHNIPVNAPTSLVVRAARSNQIVRVDNVREAEDWLPNPLLPDTYAEMAVPIILEGEVVGVLDVQEDAIGGLDEADASLLRSLAGQIAAAIRNARLFANVEASLAEAHRIQAQYLEQSWQQSNIAVRGGQYSYIAPTAPPPDKATQQHMDQTRQQALNSNSPTIIEFNGIDAKNPKPVLSEAEGSKIQNPKSVASPIILRGQTIGALQLHPGSNNREWTEQDLAMIQTIINRLAQTAENLRLFDETRERAGREHTIREITDKLRTAPNLDRLLETAAQELGQQLGVRQAVLKLGLKTAPDSKE